ncbi:class I tRNA ligase family protein [Candidatus Mycoplasma haematominutum]|uniref:leucine--tRNA ligase n=1 Tax=Candidatus Mycoplasma haematominutum 'Birmingham 1' TaxID=1116213 RepID=G8C2V8_9MOLU|nr:class I tRNA ligase family protein [Candidatus Mycoplasma haematominutum]CCE66656.1 leucyl-tRNA synthetase [Candidatus Mycoplasma haematominutum 'Birmingham 1']
MFPYPSGVGLHVGHVKGYLATDIIARYKKMKGFSVLHPIGWDAFGLPAEQFANENKSDPNTFTQKNISNFRAELKSLFFSYDFSKEIDSTDPKYYAITQWIFIQLYLRGLAAIESQKVNWVAELHTVLANEEIYLGEDGKYYSERGNFPVEHKKLNQWVLKITRYAKALSEDLKLLDWPERIKTIQNEWIGLQKVYKFTLKLKGREFYHFESDLDQLRSISGFYIYQTSEIYKLLNLSNTPKDGEVLFYYNDAQTIVKIPIQFKVGEPPSDQELFPIYKKFMSKKQLPYYIDWKMLPRETSFKLQDWIFSRQRYWGEPFPIYYDSDGHIFTEEELPLKLPPYKVIERKEGYSAPLEHYEEWMIKSPGFKRDPNTMPNWAASSWYFLAYLLKKEGGGYLPLWSREARTLIERWMPVDLYIGGQEHATMHLIYARFWYKVICEILNLKTLPEPFKYLVNQGMILGEDGKKMSKSKKNYVSVSGLLEKYGADEIRLSVAFLGPLELTQFWDNRQLHSFQTWLEKIYSYFVSIKSVISNHGLDENTLAAFLLKIESNITSFKFNMLVSELMIYFKYLKNKELKNLTEAKSFIQVLSYLAPSVAEEIWIEILHQRESVYLSTWPTIAASDTKKVSNYSIQLNNKYRLSIKLPRKLKTPEQIFAHFSQTPEYQNLILNKTLEKYIVIPHRVINLITK